MSKSIEQRVADGATFLDANVVGWVDKIDLKTLRINCLCNCVLGQLFEEYGSGLIALDVHDGRDFGFDVLEKDYMNNKAEYAALTDEWKRVILARRAAAAAQAQPAEAVTV